MIPPPPMIYMTPEDLYSWRTAHNLSKREAAAALGIARNTLRCYESGRHVIPKYIMLACDKISQDAQRVGNAA